MTDPTSPRRGWSSRDLPVVPTLATEYWSVYDAAELLGPPNLSEGQVRSLIDLIKLRPVGKRVNGSRKRHVRVYLAEKLIKAHEAVAGQIDAAD